MEKVVLFPFNGEMMCFIHVLLNALDMKDKNFDVKVVVEGAATKLPLELLKEENPMHKLWQQAWDKGLIAGTCKACSAKMGVLEAVEAAGIPLLGDMKGHPGMAGWMERGYKIITF